MGNTIKIIDNRLDPICYANKTTEKLSLKNVNLSREDQIHLLPPCHRQFSREHLRGFQPYGVIYTVFRMTIMVLTYATTSWIMSWWKKSWILIKLSKYVKIMDGIQLQYYYHMFGQSFGCGILQREIWLLYEPGFLTFFPKTWKKHFLLQNNPQSLLEPVLYHTCICRYFP